MCSIPVLYTLGNYRKDFHKYIYRYIYIYIYIEREREREREIYFKAVHHWVQAVKVLSATIMLKPISTTVSASTMVLTYLFIIF